jgi:hypothetical protein
MALPLFMSFRKAGGGSETAATKGRRAQQPCCRLRRWALPLLSPNLANLQLLYRTDQSIDPRALVIENHPSQAQLGSGTHRFRARGVPHTST